MSAVPLGTLIQEFARGEWGFTGTRAGMTRFQASVMRQILRRGRPLVLRHGGAFGADFEVHGIWREIGAKSVVNVWPADQKRANIFMGQDRVTVEPPMDPLVRNVEIVKRSEILLAAPHTEQEELRSGTWATIRAAVKQNLPTLIIWPHSTRITLFRDNTLHRVLFIFNSED